MYPALAGIREIKETAGRGQRDSQRKPSDSLSPTRESYRLYFIFCIKSKTNKNRSIDKVDP